MTVRPTDPVVGSDLARAYLAQDPRLAPFFAQPVWSSDDALWRAAEAAARVPHDRAALADALRAQNARWGADPSVDAALARLAAPESVVVVTGQQVGLFGGPLYTLHKALTAVKLAHHAEGATGRPVVPVFWMASEDHDLPEVAHARVGEAVLHLPPPALPKGHVNHGAVGRLVLDDRITAVVEAALDALPQTEHRKALGVALHAAYAPGTTLADAFARWLRHLAAGLGLVLLDPDDPALKRLGKGLFAWAARHGGAVAQVQQAGEALIAAGFHAQIPEPTAPGLFRMDAAGRLALEADGDGYRIRATGAHLTPDALAEEAEAAPEAFSAGVTLRPTWQDALLPTVAYVGGPGEIAYWAQLQGVYASAGVAMPVVYPRLSATLVDARTRRALTRLGLEPEAVTGPADALFAHHTAHDPARAAALDTAETAVRAAFAALDPVLGDVPETARVAARVKALREVTRLREKALRAERRTQQDLRAAAERAVTMLRPEGAPQERAQSVLPFAALYGPTLAAHLLAALPLDPAQAYVVEL